MEFTRRLHDDEGDVEFGDGFLQLLEAGRVVGHDEPLVEGIDINVESGFTDVDSNVDSRLGALLRRFLALHAGLAPHHLFRPSVKGRTDPAHPRFEAKGGSIPAARRAGGGHPPRVSPNPNPIGANRSCKGWQPPLA